MSQKEHIDDENLEIFSDGFIVFIKQDATDEISVGIENIPALIEALRRFIEERDWPRS